MRALKPQTTLPFENSPMPTMWSERVRGAKESSLDSETAISLACHLGRCFTDADNWNNLIKELADRRFSLCFEDGRLVLVNEDTGVSLCTCASMGHSFASLMARFGKPNVVADTGRLVQRDYAS